MEFYFAQLLTGLANASSLFLIASGLSIIFGVTRVVNFAHGSFYMVGAYICYTLTTNIQLGGFGFWLSLILSAGIVAVVGGLIEILILRRIYKAPEMFQLVATFGIVLIFQDVTLAIWGAEDLLGPRVPGLAGAVRIFGEPIPEYDLALIVMGPVVLAAIWLLFHRTRWGVLVRAATLDREMVGALGVNQNWLFTSVFVLGSFLAGLGGASQVPRESASLLMDLNVIGEAFVVVVIGGMGSVSGAFVAAVIIGVLNAFGILIFPQVALVLPFLVMAAVLVVRPWGLFGKAGSEHGAPAAPEAPLRLMSQHVTMAVGCLVVILALMPLFVGNFILVLAMDVLIASLFAASLHFLMGVGGMVSFGHAAYFGLGAYGAALATTALGFSMIPSLIIAPFVGALGALIIGWFCVRLSGVYFAMLTLAGAQIVWSITFQWGDFTGGDDGILGVWPDSWASDKSVYFYITLVLCVTGIWLIRRMAHSPFGYVLRGGRDSALRVEAIGVDLRSHQWAAFVAAGALAGLAGAVFVFSKGSVFPDEMSIARSIDGLIMVLLGGVQALSGPILGASAFVVLEDWITRFDFWRFIFGVIILTIVIAAPDGIAGGLSRLGNWWVRLRAKEAGK
jgi:branched-chain amino acid transport system permease protein